MQPFLVDISDIFFLLGEGKGESEASGGGGGSIFIENPKERGGGLLQEGERLRGREGVCGQLGNFFGGGGATYFFGGSTCPPSLQLPKASLIIWGNLRAAFLWSQVENSLAMSFWYFIVSGGLWVIGALQSFQCMFVPRMLVQEKSRRL